jgi:hypothetical protein
MYIIIMEYVEYKLRSKCTNKHEECNLHQRTSDSINTRLRMALSLTMMYIDLYKSVGFASNSSFKWNFRSTDCAKVLKYKCWNGGLQHFWPKVLYSSSPTLLPNTYVCTGRLSAVA